MYIYIYIYVYKSLHLTIAAPFSLPAKMVA